LKPGPIALVGSGEYLPVMAEIEAKLIAGRPSNYIQIPTAAAPEGESTLSYWQQLIRNRADAQNPEFSEKISNAGLIYFSGGDPHYLADTLRDTKLWDSIYAAWQNGAALAGCSAGAMAIANHIPSIRSISKQTTSGLGILPNIRVLPHFDRMFAKIGATILHYLQEPKDLTVVGIDEETALVGGLTQWEVQGNKSVWIFKNGEKTQYFAGDKITLNN
jgi:cyanophycinase-like exopeptidase